MYCNGCGSKLQENERFCTTCGWPVDDPLEAEQEESLGRGPENTAVRRQQPTQPSQSGERINPYSKPQGSSERVNPYSKPQGNGERVNPYIKPQRSSEKNSPYRESQRTTASGVGESIKAFLSRFSKKTLAIAGASLVVVIVLIIVLCVSSKRIDISDYMTVTFSGMNTRGVAQVEFDTDAFSAALDEKYPTSNEKKSQSFDDYFEAYDNANNNSKLVRSIRATIEYELDRYTLLANGESVTLMIDFDEKVCEEYGVKLKGGEFTYEVKGLLDGTGVDLFEGVVVDFSGVSPYGYASIDSSNAVDPGFPVWYELSQTSNLKEGDSVVISADYNEDDAIQALRIVASDTKEVPVKLPILASELDFTGDVLQELAQNVERRLTNKYPAREFYNYESTVSFSLSGIYLYKRNGLIDYDYYDCTNRVWVVFEFVYIDNSGDTKSYFLCMYVGDIYLDENGCPIIDEEMFKEGRFYDTKHQSNETIEDSLDFSYGYDWIKLK